MLRRMRPMPLAASAVLSAALLLGCDTPDEPWPTLVGTWGAVGAGGSSGDASSAAASGGSRLQTDGAADTGGSTLNTDATSGEPAPRRIIAMGDLHSDIGSTRAAFQLAGATDANDAWVGGDLTVVQLGDIIGRSDDEREVLDFMLEVRAKAAAKGGTVHVLLGNHEVMGGRVDNQAVGPNPFPAYEGMVGLDLADPRLQILPVNERARGAALMAGGPYAKKLAEHPTVLKVGDTVYVHGGVVPRWAEYGIEKINSEVSEWLRGNVPEPDSSLGVDDGDRVMWTRQFSRDVDAADCATLDESLAILGARRMIVAHTVQPTITPRCGDKVWAVDVGMSRAYGGPIEVLEIVEDRDLTVLRP